MTAAPTGVHRVAEELILAYADLAEVGGNASTDLYAPIVVVPQTARRDIEHDGLVVRKAKFLSGILKDIPWEQLHLPWITRGKLLINLCNLGPVIHSSSITMVHDAQVYITPDSYSRGFRAWYKFVQPWLGKNARKILTVSHYSKSELARYGVADSDKIEVIHNGCDHVLRVTPRFEFVSEKGLTPGRYVVALANTQKHKNISVLLEAFRSSRMADLTLVLFGSATRANFVDLGHSVPENVRFVGKVSDEELAALIKHAALYACPSLTEGFGLPPLEAMALGCPTIVAPCGALPEVCGEAAIYADPYISGEWVSAMRQVVDDKALADRLRGLGLDRSAIFTWEQAARRLRAIISAEGASNT